MIVVITVHVHDCTCTLFFPVFVARQQNSNYTYEGQKLIIQTYSKEHDEHVQVAAQMSQHKHLDDFLFSSQSSAMLLSK